MIELNTLLKAYNIKPSAKSSLKNQAQAAAKDYIIFSLVKNNTPKAVIYNYNASTKELVKAKDIKNANALALYAKYLNKDKELASYIVNDKIGYKAS